jgi:hypothetical protein
MAVSVPIGANYKKGIKMKPASDEDIENIRIDYERFLSLGQSKLKSAYLAVSGRGFLNVIKTGTNVVMLERESDHRYIICSYPQVDIPEKPQNEMIVRFHVDKKVL